MAYLPITAFLGINSNTDPRRIKPNSDKELVAEAVEMSNMDITREGSMVTSSGYEAVSNIADTEGVKHILSYDKDESDRYMIITHKDKHYSVNPSSFTWDDTNLGTYGTEADFVGGTVYKGAAGDRLAILGNELLVNTTQKADITNPMAGLADADPGGYIMAVFMGRLFIGIGSTLYYSNVDDEDDFAGGGTIGFNDIITGMKVEGQRLIVFTRTYNQGVTFQYDDSWNLSVPLKEPYERKYGCLAWRSLQDVGSTAYYLSERGVMAAGAENGYDDAGLPRPMSLSEKIEPSLKFINKGYRNKIVSEYIEADQQYWLGVPYGVSQVPSVTFVYFETWKAWITREGFYPGDFAVMRSTDYEEELYFADANSPYLYRFNSDKYSYDGVGYTRKWKSKKFTMGNGRAFKEFRGIDLAGSMDAGTVFYITLEVDNAQKKYKIDNTFLLKNSLSDYIGDNWKGDAYLGGGSPTEAKFKRFYAPLDFPKEIREGIELQITIENDGAEQPFKIDFLGIEYEMRSPKQVPRKRYVNTQVTT